VTEELPRIERHEAVDRFGTAALRAAHDLGEALAAGEDEDPEPVVVRRGGAHRSIDGLAAVLDEALGEEDPGDEDGVGSRGGEHDPPARS
jgi:hypothetical protein